MNINLDARLIYAFLITYMYVLSTNRFTLYRIAQSFPHSEETAFHAFAAQELKRRLTVDIDPTNHVEDVFDQLERAEILSPARIDIIEAFLKQRPVGKHDDDFEKQVRGHLDYFKGKCDCFLV